MPQYSNSPFSNAGLALRGVPYYLFGSYDYKVGNSNMAVQTVAIASNVATVTALLLNGPAPAAGWLVSILNTVQGAGEFNVKRVALTTVSIDNATNVVTMTFPLTGTNIGPVADAGTMVGEQPEVAETLAAGASVAVCFPVPRSDSQFTVPLSVRFPTIPTDVTVTLQTAIRDHDEEYTNTSTSVVVAASAYTSGPTVEATLQKGYFYRLLVSGLSGTGTVVAKIGA